MPQPSCKRVERASPSRARFRCGREPRLTWRTATAAPDWVQRPRRARAHAAVGHRRRRLSRGGLVRGSTGRSRRSRRGTTSGSGSGSPGPATRYRLERAAAHPRRLPGATASGSPLRSACAAPAEEAQPGLARTEFEIAGDVAPRLALRDRASASTRRRQRRRRRRPGAQAGLDAVPVRDSSTRRPTSPACSSPGRNALGIRFAGGWATERLRLPRQAAPALRRPARGGRAAGDRVRGRPTEVVATDAPGGPRPGRSPPAGIYAGRGPRRPLARDAGWAPSRASTTPAGRAAAGVDADSSRRAPAPRRSCAGSRSSPVREVITTPAGRTVLDFGQNLVGRLRIRVDGPGRHRDHAAPRRGARARRARHPAAARRRGDRPLHPRAATAPRLGARVHLPRLPLRRGRRAGRASSTRPPSPPS